MVVYPSALDLSTSHLRFLTVQPAAHRAERGTRWRRLPPCRQALLVLGRVFKVGWSGDTRLAIPL